MHVFYNTTLQIEYHELRLSLMVLSFKENLVSPILQQK